MYRKLAGMTGTAATESEEFAKIYNLDVTIIPTNKPMIRKDLNDRIYKSEAGKFKAVVQEIKARNEKGQPVLVGTISIEKNELLSELLSREGIKHELLNAKNHAREAEILAQAGRLGAVTVATNMAGRGVDIVLGGNPSDPKETEKVIKLGGLHVLGTERHEARRIDNQLRGRAGRQGDPGSSQFFVSLDDDLMRIFGSERMKSLMTTLKVPEDLPIENKLISKSIESAQKRVEGNNFDIRKHLVEYDDVLNKQRNVIYKKRQEIIKLSSGQSLPNGLSSQSTKDLVLEMINKEIEQLVTFHSAASDQQEIIESLNTIFPLTDSDKSLVQGAIKKDLPSAIKFIQKLATDKYNQLEEQINQAPQFSQEKEPLRKLENYLLLKTIDSLWIEHLEAIEHLRTGIGLRGYGQRDPLIEYKKESFNLFQQLLDLIQEQIVHSIFKMGLAVTMTLPQPSSSRPIQEIKTNLSPFAAVQKNQAANQTPQATHKLRDATGHKVGRNDPCPCGSGKKYKRCHGA